jgi:hypothetical protein
LKPWENSCHDQQTQRTRRYQQEREREGNKKSIPRQQNGEPELKAPLFLPPKSIRDNERNYAAKMSQNLLLSPYQKILKSILQNDQHPPRHSSK